MNKATSSKKDEPIKKKKKKFFDMGLFMIVFILVAFGIVMVLSASSPSALAKYGNSYVYLKTQAEAAGLGLIIMLIISFINYKIYQKFYIITYILAVGLLLIVKIPGVGIEANGALRWASIGSTISFQPSELSKILLIMSFAGYFTSPKIDFKKIRYACIIPNIMLIIPVVILYFVQDHLSAGIIIFVTAATMIFMSGIELRYLTLSVTGGLSLIGIALYAFRNKLSSSFRGERIDAWLHPENYARGTAYQTLQSLYAIGSGGLWGVRLADRANKNINIYQNLTMTLYLQS